MPDDDATKPTVAERPAREPAIHEADTALPRPSAPDVTRPERPNAAPRERPVQPPARYTSGEEIARGGMGRVVEATDTLLDRVVAVKQALTLDPEMLRRFARETKITARLEHPSIVPLYDAGIDGDAPFYVMRRVSGRPLSELLADAPTLADRLALIPNLLATAQAVAHAHSRGIVHRDIKPSNILVGEHGETVVIDWGLAKVVDDVDDEDPLAPSAGDSLRTRVGTVFGTPGFMSPGQLRGEPVGYGADVYALGASLYFMLAGKPPHHAPTGDAMMALAAKGPPAALTDFVSGVPRELSTIVETALAYGERHYENAGAFADDLRRFSTGQLVASHRYSAGERLRRFVRKHRAAVAIGFAAIVVVAVVATISVQRILAERDRADAKANDAAAAQHSERERVDQLLLLRARTLVDTNPTEAIAVLKDLAPTSMRVAEGHAIANAAIMRGVARGIRGPEAISSMADLDPSGNRLLQIAAATTLHVWDLFRRTQTFTKKFSFGVRGLWIGNKILIHGSEGPAYLDPDTGVVAPLPLPKLKYVVATDDQSMLVAETETHQLLVIDPAKLTATPYLVGRSSTNIVVAGDGSWFAAGDGSEIVVFSRQGRELARRSGRYSLMRASRSRHLAVIDDGTMLELEIAGTKATWRTFDTSKYHPIVVMFAFRDEELLIAMGSGHILSFREDRLVEVARPEAGISFAAELGEGEQIFMAGSNQLVFFSSSGNRTIRLPHAMSTPRIAARRGQRRIAILSGEAILVYDLDDVAPRRIPTKLGTLAFFLDEATLLLSTADRTEYWWHDLQTGRETPIAGDFRGLTEVTSADEAAGTALISLFNGEQSAEFRVRKNEATAELLHRGSPYAASESFPNGTMLYAAGSTIGLQTTPAVSRELVTFKHPVAMIAALGADRFVAISVRGELARGDVTGGPIERAQLPEPPTDSSPIALTGRAPPPSTFAVDRDNTVSVSWGPKIWKWTERLEQLAELDGWVHGVYVVERYLLALLPSARAVLIDRDSGEIHTLPAHGEPVILNGDGTLLALEIGGYYQILEPRSRMFWPTPIPRMTTPLATSPSGRQLVMRVPELLALWKTPHGSGPIRTRLEQHTNAIVSSDGQLVWPWRQR